MKFKSMLPIVVALLIGCVAFPVTLHQMTLSRIREATFTAARFAAATPDALRMLPVTHWEEGAAVSQPQLSKTGWEQYRMTVPEGEKSIVMDLDLRSTIVPLLLGFGGALRIVVMLFVSGAVVYVMLRGRGIPSPSGEGGRRPDEGEAHSNRSLIPALSREERGITALPQKIMAHLPYAAFLFDRHHQLIHWNDAAQSAIAHLTLTPGIHLLDLSAHLSWGSTMLEKMDELTLQQTQPTPDHVLMIHKGDSLCVIPG